MEVKIKKIVPLQNDEQLKGMLQLAVWSTELTKSSGKTRLRHQALIVRMSQYDRRFIPLSV